ncbi:MAG: radical SAM protein [Desulfuromonadales bacterium]|nr:radical SAM protein [Desulfuromonadales bacterium]
MMTKDPFQPDDIVKSCCKLESGLNLSIQGIRACTRGALMPPLFCSAEDVVQGVVTKDFIVAKRKEYIRMLNDDQSEMDCKQCLMVEQKRYGDISFSRLGHVDLQHYSICNLRCSYCAYTRDNMHYPAQYDALAVLNVFSADEVEWNAHVDFAGGEPTLLENLEGYLEFFRNRRIRVLMFTNGVEFHQAIYDGLADGSIYIAATSVDAGTPSTYRALRGRDSYLQVLENLSRYAVAGSKGKGMLAAKYIFCESNYGDDDIAGFAYAMLALRPQQVWLTFDFAPMFLRQADRDCAPQIEAYAKLYLLLRKHGLEPFHYYKEAIATVSQEGKKIMDRLLSAIDRHGTTVPLGNPDLVLRDFRSGDQPEQGEPERFTCDPLSLTTHDGKLTPWSLEGKRVLLVPACPATQKLLSDREIQRADWIGFIDRNPIQQGKTLDGRTIYGYEDIPAVAADVILVVPPEKHRSEILKAISRNMGAGTQLAELA